MKQKATKPVSAKQKLASYTEMGKHMMPGGMMMSEKDMKKKMKKKHA
jgi:hypothetical protein